MAAKPSVSVILCTHNRAPVLAQTLSAFASVRIPEEWDCELLVVDNASTDQTPATVRGFDLGQLKLRYVPEARPGKGHALNTAFRTARGDVLLSTDDDVRPAREWLEQLAGPMVRGEADAVGGRIVLAPELMRPWITPTHLARLACCEGFTGKDPGLIGANMGFRRGVLAKVPAIDVELGPGGMVGEDTLFGRQVQEAGYRVKFVPDAVITHCPDPKRLRRSAWLQISKAQGRKDAYFAHHWEYDSIDVPRLQIWRERAKLAVRRRLHPPGGLEDEGCALWEMGYVSYIEACRQFLIERRRPRNYARRGLVKINGEI